MVIDTHNGGIGRNRLGSTATPDTTAATKNTTKQATPSPSTGDSVSLSDEAQAMNRLEAKINSSPDIDQAKVDQIKSAIDNGEYQPDPSAIADKMLDQL